MRNDVSYHKQIAYGTRLVWLEYVFEKLRRNVCIFLNTDYLTGEKLDVTESSPLAKFPYFFDEANTDYQINTIFPTFVQVAHPERNIAWNFDMGEFFNHIKAFAIRKANSLYMLTTMSLTTLCT